MQELTIQNWLTRNARIRPDHPGLICQGQRWSYERVNREVNRVVRAFQASGLKKGDKVATYLPNCIELMEVYWACAKLGAVVVPLSPLLRDPALTSLIENSDSRLVLTKEELARHLGEAKEKFGKKRMIWTVDSRNGEYHERKSRASEAEPEVERVVGSDPYNIIYSSGTTGTPKGIVLSHAVRALYGTLFANSFRILPESRVLHSGSMVFNGAFVTLMPSMCLGTTFVLEESFKPSTLIERFKSEKITHTILVPSQIVACLQYDGFARETCPSLECILSIGAPLLKEHKDELNRRLPGVFYELYGLTEGFMTILDRTQSVSKLGSVGCTPPFMEMKIIKDNGEIAATREIGEINGSSPLLMTEYYENPQQTTEAVRDGWLKTGDLGYVDEDGFLFLTGRKKDMIISGGVNVYPVDIEQLMIQHPLVQDVAVFGVPHKEWGEAPVAAVVVKNKSERANADEMREWVNSRVGARFQKVHRVWIIDELPRNAGGKVLKHVLAKSFNDNS